MNPVQLVGVTDLNVKHGDVRGLLILARNLDWRISHPDNSDLWVLNSPARGYSGKHINLPYRSGLNAGKFRQHAHAIVRYGSTHRLSLFTPEQWEMHLRSAGVEGSYVTTISNALRASGKLHRDTRVEELAGENRSIESVVKLKQRESIIQDGIEHFPDGTLRDAPRAEVVSLKPYRAHHGTAGTYESKALMERTWSDGRVDYVCRWPGCEKPFDKVQSGATHYGRHRRGEGRDTTNPTDGPRAKPIDHRRDARIAALAAEIREATVAGNLGPESVARYIIDKRIEAGDHGDGDHAAPTKEELTSDEILDRIAAMIDRGRVPELESRLDQQRRYVASMQTRIDQVLVAVAMERARADKAEGNLAALRDLLKDV